jgi:hypothetical protein
MRTEQAAFDFTAPPPPISEVELLLNHLSNNPGFHTCKKLSSALGLSDRVIREIAEQNPELIVSGPGSPGYCHLYHCPDEQTGHITEMLISQGKKMIRRAIRTRRAARLRALHKIRF